MSLIQLDYPITRQFRWRWFSPLAIFGAVVAIAILAVLNVALAGYQSTVVFSNDYNLTNPLWYDKFRSKFQHPEPLCDPHLFNIADFFTTSYSLFQWTIDSVTKPSAGETGVLYHATPLDECDLSTLYIDGDINTKTIDFIPVVTCPQNFGIKMKSSFSITALPGRNSRLPGATRFGTYDGVGNPITAVLDTIGQYAGIDISNRIGSSFITSNGTTPVILSFQVDFPPCPASLGPSAPCASLKPTFNISYSALVYSNSTSDSNDLSLPIGDDNPYLINDDFYNPLMNLIQVIYAGIRIDLGNPSPNNFILHPNITNATLFSSFPQTMYNTEGSSDLYEYWTTTSEQTGLSRALPVNITDPAYVQVVYLCRVQRQKPGGELFISVLVATLSMFMSGWAIFMFAATSIAKRREEANICDVHNPYRFQKQNM